MSMLPTIFVKYFQNISSNELLNEILLNKVETFGSYNFIRHLIASPTNLKTEFTV